MPCTIITQRAANYIDIINEPDATQNGIHAASDLKELAWHQRASTYLFR
jgi:hypothetical protein